MEREEPEQVNVSQTIIEENLNNFPFPFPEETSSITIKLHIFNSNIDIYKNIVINKNINNRELHYLVYQKLDLLDISMIERIYYNDIIVPFNPEENVAGQITESGELLILINDDFQTHNSINFLSSSTLLCMMRWIQVKFSHRFPSTFFLSRFLKFFLDVWLSFLFQLF